MKEQIVTMDNYQKQHIKKLRLSLPQSYFKIKINQDKYKSNGPNKKLSGQTTLGNLK